MSLPPTFLDELRARLSLGQVVGRKVMWDNRKSNQGKGDLWAPCPFHQEKTASFHVDDRKGFYYCFGCHAKGDAISFVMETENVPFMEAIEILAGEAGMQMPARDPAAKEKQDERARLHEVMDEAIRWFRLQLRTAAGAEARAYLDRRGLGEAARERWEIGFAPPGWEGLREALMGRGIDVKDLLACGLVRNSDKGRAPYDVFRGRIMFPIRDGRGRPIAFGGRAMDPSDNAKYLNSPETRLFDKGRSLYNHAPAREAAGKGQPLIVAEGYMDVIALAEAGFGASVAPLGTAITEEQLALLWRIAPEPVIALDGDAAGLRAAMRVIDLALPLMEVGKSLRFALMPQGQDPDDLLRAKGPEAVKQVLDGALPMVDLLWRRETEGKSFDSPERRAALDHALRGATGKIRDPSLRHHYDQALKDRKWELFRGQRPAKPRRAWTPGKPPPEPVRAETRGSILAAAGDSEDRLREAAILATLVVTPGALTEFEAEIERMECRDPAHRRIRDAILRLGAAQDLRAELAHDLGEAALETLFAERHVAITPAVRRPGDIETARLGLAEDLARLGARRGQAREIAEAALDVEGVADEGLTWRLAQAARALERAGRGDGEDRAEYETGPNGAKVRREERTAFADLLGRIDYAKGGARGGTSGGGGGRPR
ncbi:DNA primase [Wenxinia saemankumensis]|uniref:DNA primase n=1 Tax=Wenxinia saemankumensis TaxID=1447782 RepID=A0A1M6GZJ6_9RHOB|nr:DNA primase [Wenxinia saemankumensis]SHJ15371.1 DNA primase [Wenxinia saemankumensis]